MKIYKEKGYWYLETKGMVYRSLHLKEIIATAFKLLNLLSFL